MQRTPFHLSLAVALLGAAACTDHAGPLAPTQADTQPPALSSGLATGFFDVGELSYDKLLEEEGAFAVQMGINRGLLSAARTGEADFYIKFDIRASNYIEQDIVVPPATLSLALLKSLGGAAGMEDVAFAVPWDGLDSEGQPVVGEVVIEYRITLEFRPNPTGDGIVIIILGAVEGSTLVVIA